MSRRQRRESLEPNLTPLIDIVFLLLIFFIVTSVFKSDELKLLVQLPKTQSGVSVKNEDTKKIIIELKDNLIHYQNKKYSNYLNFEKELSKNDNKLIVELRGDKDTKYGKFMELFDILKRNKFSNINLITKKKIRGSNENK